MRQRARVGDVVVSPLHARALKIGTDSQIRKLLVLNFAETTALVSRPRRSAMVTRILLGVGNRGRRGSCQGRHRRSWLRDARPGEAVTKAQAAAGAAYDKPLHQFKDILAKRRAQIDASASGLSLRRQTAIRTSADVDLRFAEPVPPKFAQ